MNTSKKYAVEMFNITKTFGDKVKANKSVNLKVTNSEIHALVGENGAGKTTLMKILYGMYQPDEGSIKINGNHEKISSSSKAIELQIGMVHQHFMLVNPLTVLENIILGDETTSIFKILDVKSSTSRIRQLIDAYKITVDTQTPVADIPVGMQQKVEILKILYRNAEILILDEPTAVLTQQEIDDLFKTLKDLKVQGKTIIFITHKLDEVMAISDSVTVMRQGEIVGDFETASINKEELAKLMVGYEIKYKPKEKTAISEKNILEVKGLFILNDKHIEAVKDVLFDLKGGEILGIAGVEGNGQSELVEAITGLRKIHKGTVKIIGKDLSKDIITAHIPADRNKNGIVMSFTVSENLVLGRQREKRFASIFLINEKNISDYSTHLIEKYDIRPKSTHNLIKELSGGNQQKVIVARELSKNSDLIVANHPTRGLDIKATSFVHDSILGEKAKGKAILLVSSDLSEIIKLSDRIGVMYKGELVTILETEKTNEREIGLFMMGAGKT